MRASNVIFFSEFWTFRETSGKAIFIVTLSVTKKHHSTETLVLEIIDETLIGFEKNSATVMILLDMSAAFDTVDLNKLLKILEHRIGLKGTVLRCFESFLLGRKQKVQENEVTSELLITLYGVPQGSVLGPVRVNIYVSSLPSVMENMGSSTPHIQMTTMLVLNCLCNFSIIIYHAAFLS